MVVLSGLLLGTLAKMADQSALPGAADIGTYLGIWIVLITVTAVRARSRGMAAVRAASLMAAMVVAYYAATYLYFRLIPPRDIAVWGIATLTGVPVLAVLVWPARESGWFGALAVALPVGLLAAEALTLRHHPGLHPAPLGFDVVAALSLLWFLPRDQLQRSRAVALAVPAAFLGSWLLSVGFGLAAGVLMRAVV